MSETLSWEAWAMPLSFLGPPSHPVNAEGLISRRVPGQIWFRNLRPQQRFTVKKANC